jgi:hypothetical protein
MKQLNAGQGRKRKRADHQRSTKRVPLSPRLDLPDSARVFWRVEPRVSRDGQQVAVCETVDEAEALAVWKYLSNSGSPALVSRWQIYRVRILPQSPLGLERFAFVEAYSEDDACCRVAAAFAGFDKCSLDDIHPRVSAKSFEQCRLEGVSLDPEFRLFETEWAEGRVTGWVREPMFLLPTPSVLTRKWSRIPGRATQ